MEDMCLYTSSLENNDNFYSRSSVKSSFMGVEELFTSLLHLITLLIASH